MLRTQISLTEHDRQVLDEAAARSGRSIAALIRDAVHVVYGAPSQVVDDLDVLASTSGVWVGRTGSAADEVDRLRSGRRMTSHG